MLMGSSAEHPACGQHTTKTALPWVSLIVLIFSLLRECFTSELIHERNQCLITFVLTLQVEQYVNRSYFRASKVICSFWIAAQAA